MKVMGSVTTLVSNFTRMMWSIMFKLGLVPKRSNKTSKENLCNKLKMMYPDDYKKR